jgi:hypothetical protein
MMLTVEIKELRMTNDKLVNEFVPGTRRKKGVLKIAILMMGESVIGAI